MLKCYFLWGAGGVGRRALKYLQPLGILDGIIDSDCAKHGQELGGFKITDYNALRPLPDKAGVIITHFDSDAAEAILKRDKVRCWKLSEFITEWYWAQHKQHAVEFLDLPITTRCSLNCRACMQYIPYRSKQDVPLTTLKQDLKALFNSVDFVGEISIIGGEPFLHKQLPELLEYIRKNYTGRIGSLVITTNGTIVPDSHILELCREMGVFISVSDYSQTVPSLEEKIASLEAKAQEHCVNIERKRWTWTDPGRFDAINDVKDCARTHMQLSDGKLWHCTLMAAASAANFCEAKNGIDYYNLSQENGNALQSVIRGNNPQGRTTVCRKCKSAAGIKIPAAEQL